MRFFLALVMAVSLLVAPIQAQTAEYHGFTEVYKGEGIWSLIIKWDGSRFTTERFAGAVAEFARRHPKLKIQSIAPIHDSNISGAETHGLIIVTTEK